MIRRAVLIGLAAVALAAGLPARADDYPSRNVIIVCPYPAGGPTDQLARIIADYLSKQMNQSFVVENVTGGGTIIATNKVVKATPDGYTLLLHNLQISANLHALQKLAVRHREGPHARHLHQPQSAGVDRRARIWRRAISTSCSR